MRRLKFGVVLSLTLVTAVALMPGCKRKPPVTVQMTEEGGGGTAALASVVHVADPKTSVQLIKGFYDVEQNSWRWTMGKFSVALRAPTGAAQKGAKLTLRFSLPEAVLKSVKSVTISAKANGADVAPETFTKTGDMEYSKDVPASAFKNESVTVDFTLDKFLAAGSVDARELGVVVTSIGLEAK